MPRSKRNSRILSNAELRFASLRSISDTLNLGNGLTLAEYATRIEDLRTKLADYNQVLSTVDRAIASVEAAEAEVKNLSELMLLGVTLNQNRSASTKINRESDFLKGDRK